jgi:hypothetical protein
MKAHVLQKQTPLLRLPYTASKNFKTCCTLSILLDFKQTFLLNSLINFMALIPARVITDVIIYKCMHQRYFGS